MSNEAIVQDFPDCTHFFHSLSLLLSLFFTLSLNQTKAFLFFSFFPTASSVFWWSSWINFMGFWGVFFLQNLGYSCDYILVLNTTFVTLRHFAHIERLSYDINHDSNCQRHSWPIPLAVSSQNNVQHSLCESPSQVLKWTEPVLFFRADLFRHYGCSILAAGT